jgi:hypothetical protein
MKGIGPELCIEVGTSEHSTKRITNSLMCSFNWAVLV